jgi:dolichyl-phosphate-mannose-protein mannosyltransferase
MTPDSSTLSSPRRNLLAGFVFLTVIVAVQWSLGAYRVEAGIFDDTSHLMQGLLVRDYLTEGLRQNPAAFAADYQKSYPNLDAGTPPSWFHGGLGLFLLPDWPPNAAALLLLAAIVAWATWRLYQIVALVATPSTGFILCLLFLSTPTVVGFTTSVTLDGVVAACAVEATYWLAVYLTSDRLRHAVLFGLFAGACWLTTSYGIALMLMPLVTVALTGRFDRLRRSGLYLATAIVLLVLAPGLIGAALLDLPIAFEDRFSRLGVHMAHVWLQLGAVAMMLAAIGLVYVLGRGRRSPADPPAAIGLALAALLATSFIFSFFGEQASAFSRSAALALPALFGLAPMGVRAASSFVAGPRRGQTLYTALLIVFVVTAFYARPPLAVRRPSGYQAVTDYLQSRDGIAGKRVLIVSDPSGENIFVTDVAMRRLDPRPVIVRGSDLLASDDSSGNVFVIRYRSAQAIIQAIEDLHIDYLLVDSSADSKALPYWSLMNQVVESRGESLQLEYNNTVDRRNGPTRPLAIYRLKHPIAGSTQAPAEGVPPTGTSAQPIARHGAR